MTERKLLSEHRRLSLDPLAVEALSTGGFLSWLPIDDYLNRIFKIFPGDFNGTTALDL